MSIRTALRRTFLSLVALFLFTIVSLSLTEVGAYLWLTRMADPDQFSRYATLGQMRSRYQEAGQASVKYAPHRYIGYVPSANYRGLRFGVYHNSLGFRSPEIPLVKPPGEFRIVALGGSTTYGLYPKLEDVQATREFIDKISTKEEAEADPAVQNVLKHVHMPDVSSMLYALSYPGYLEAKLRERGYENVRVVNAGAEGYTSWESMINFQLRCLDLDPDMVTIYHGYNDIHSRLIWPYEAYRGDNSGQISHSSGWYQPLPLHLRSTALRILLTGLGRARSPADLVSTYGTIERTAKFWAYEHQLLQGRYPSGFFVKHSVEELLAKNSPVYFKRNIENIVLTAQHRGIQPVLFTFASSGPGKTSLFNTTEYRAALAEHNDIIRQIGSDLGVPVFDLAALFPQDPELFQDTVHMTTDGGWLKAELIADFLISEHLLDAR